MNLITHHHIGGRVLARASQTTFLVSYKTTKQYQILWIYNTCCALFMYMGFFKSIMTYFYRSSSKSRSNRRDSSSSIDPTDNSTVANPDDVNVDWSGDGVSTHPPSVLYKCLCRTITNFSASIIVCHDCLLSLSVFTSGLSI